MILEAERISEIKRGLDDTIVVESDPPAVGATDWLRTSPRARPELRVRVADTWPHVDGGHVVRVEPVEEDQAPRKPKPKRDGFSLSAEHRAQLLREDYRPLLFDDEPECKQGDTYVLVWSRRRRIFDEHGGITVFPPEPVWWIELTHDPIRRAKGGWAVRYNVEDRRFSARLLSRVVDPGAPEPDITSDPRAASDHVQVEPTDWDGTQLAVLAEARKEYRDLHERPDWEQETRSLAHRIRRVRATARERGVDDSVEIQAIREWLGELERKLEAAA